MHARTLVPSWRGKRIRKIDIHLSCRDKSPHRRRAGTLLSLACCLEFGNKIGGQVVRSLGDGK